MRKYLIVFLLSVMCSTAFSQGIIDKKVGKAQTYIFQEEYGKAATLIHKLMEEYGEEDELKWRLGECYYHMEEYDLAAYWTLQVQMDNWLPCCHGNWVHWIGCVYPADLWLRQGNVDKAAEVMKICWKAYNSRSESPLRVDAPDYKSWLDSLATMNGDNIEIKPAYFNTEYDELFPQMAGGKFYFQQEFRGRQEKGFTFSPKSKYRIKFLEFSLEKDNVANKINSVNDVKSLEKGFHIQPDGKTFLYAYKFDYFPEERLIPRRIYERRLKGKELRTMPFNSDHYACEQPFVSDDGRYLFFVSNMPGGFGGDDIYVSARDSVTGMWEPPQNLGQNVNTDWHESSPYFDGDTLYFSTLGVGLGGEDVYKIKWSYAGGTDGYPLNLGAPINSRGDDWGFRFIGENAATLSSNREGGEGGYDVYFIYYKNKPD